MPLNNLVILDEENQHILKERSIWFKGKYPAFNMEGKTIKLHHYVIGKPPKGFVTDHINRNVFDNRKSNLRHVHHSENMRNRASYGASGLKGAYLDKKRPNHKKQWKAEAKIDGKKVYLGWHETREQAHEAYKEYVIKVSTLYV